MPEQLDPAVHTRFLLFRGVRSDDTSTTLAIPVAWGMPSLISGKCQEYCLLRGGGGHDIVERHGTPVKDIGAVTYSETGVFGCGAACGQGEVQGEPGPAVPGGRRVGQMGMRA